MFVFDPFLLILFVFISSFIPGSILSLATLKNSNFKLIERILIGCSIGLIILPAFLFFANLIGIKFSYSVVVLSIFLFYVISLLIFVKLNTYDSLKNLKLVLNKEELVKDSNKLYSYLLTFFLLLIVVLAFWIRLQSYTPIFQELDPYYYTYSTYQVLTLGVAPFDDKTAWYPDIITNHRAVPVMIYLEAIWYSLYTGGAQPVDNYLLATVAGVYPPIAASLAIFGLYLLFASNYRREFALIGAAVASFLPIFILKLTAGEMEVQPFGFLTLTLSLALYAWMLKEKNFNLKLSLFSLLSIAYFGLLLGSSSAQVFNMAIMLFIPVFSILLFIRKNTDIMLDFIKFNSAFILVAFYVSPIILSIYAVGTVDLNYSFLIPSMVTIVLMAEVFFSFLLYFISLRYLKDTETSLYILAGLVFLGAILFLFTPFGSTIKDIGVDAVRAATFDTALKRTIAEQGTAGGAFQGQLGFISYFPEEIANTILNPQSFVPLNGLLTSLLGLVIGLFSWFTNSFFSLFAFTLNSLLGAQIEYDIKSPSLLLSIIALVILGLLASFIRFLKSNEDSDNFLSILFFTIVFPPALVGIVKAKFTIYMGFFFAGALAVVFGEVHKLIPKLFKRETKDYNYAYLFLLFLGVSLVLFQFTQDYFAFPVLENSLKPRFQDNPLALKAKFTSVCNQLKIGNSYDDDVCGAAEDPVAYASKGTNYQFSGKLCSVSLSDNPLNPTENEKRAISFRCQRLTDYWIESMEWLRYNTEKDSRTTSWWDYGHWINYFGLKNAVLRNEHLSLDMIGEVAHAYIDGTPDDLIQLMYEHDSKYALFDGELLYGGSVLGGKYGALNYLSCDYDNKTDVGSSPGRSLCEAEHLWETIYIPKDPSGQECAISSELNKKGTLAYTQVVSNDAAAGIAGALSPTYCVGDALLANGQTTSATHYLNKNYENGDLRLNKAILKYDYDTSEGILVYTAFYTNDQIWLENGEVKSGYEDRKGKFYDSNLYRAFFLNDLPGFDLVFTSKGGEVKIYKLKE